MLNVVQMKRKNGGVTLGRVLKALEGDQEIKWYLGHGRGFAENDIGFQAMRPILYAGVDSYLGAADRLDYALDGHRHSQMPAYDEMFSFNAIPYLTAGGAPTWTFGGVPINTKFRIRSEQWHFRFANSSFSSIILDFYQFCPRRDIFTTEDTISATMQLAANYESVGSTQDGANFDTSETENVFHHHVAPKVDGVTPFDNRQLTQDYLIKHVGHKVMEPGANFEWMLRKGRYTYETPDALNPVVGYRKGRMESLWVRIRGEPVKCTSNDPGTGGTSGTTTFQDVTSATGKLIWNYDYRIKWEMPIQELRNKVTVRQTDLGATTAGPTIQADAGFPSANATNPQYLYTASSALQVQSVPVPSGGLTGFLPTTV